MAGREEVIRKFKLYDCAVENKTNIIISIKANLGQV